MLKKILMITVLSLLVGCVTTPGTVPVETQAKQFVQGAKWVLAVTDPMMATACGMGYVSPEKCQVYVAAVLLLNSQITQLSNPTLSPEELQKALTRALLAYEKIDAAYRGQM